MSKFFKLLLNAFVVVTLMAFMSGCGEKKPVSSNTPQTSNVQVQKQEVKLDNELNILNWEDYMPQSVMDGFAKKYNVKVNLTTFTSEDDLLKKIEEGKGKYDLTVVSDNSMPSYKKDGTIQKIDLNNITNLKNIDKNYLNQEYDPKNEYSVPYVGGNIVIVVNTNKIKEPIKGYKDLLNPKYKNSIVCVDDKRTIFGLMSKSLGYSINETEKSKVEEVKQQFRKLIPNIKMLDNAIAYERLIKGDASIGLVWLSDAVRATNEKPYLKCVLPQEGMFMYMDNLCVINGAPHKKTAEAYINYLLEPKVSAAISSEFLCNVPNKVAQKYVDQTLLNNPAVYPPEEILKKSERVITDNSIDGQVDEVWNELLKKLQAKK